MPLNELVIGTGIASGLSYRDAYAYLHRSSGGLPSFY
jgi:hypothetical protein